MKFKSISDTETVQLYIHDTVATISRPLRELKDFKKVSLNPGEATELIFRIGMDKLGYYMPGGKYIIEKGIDIYRRKLINRKKNINKNNIKRRLL